jgi:hypothetical protein
MLWIFSLFLGVDSHHRVYVSQAGSDWGLTADRRHQAAGHQLLLSCH